MRITAIASLVMLHSLQPVGAAELGRLFHTPEERKALDAARTKSAQAQKPANTQAIQKAEPARLEGYVVRSQGPSTLWIDGRAIRLAPGETKPPR